MKILGLIPARYGSTRLPGKALEIIGGKTMIQRVYEQASKCPELSAVMIATDHDEIAKKSESFNARAILTSAEHRSGTDRVAEALEKSGDVYDYVINIQGDEPFIDPSQISLLAGVLDGKTEIATLAKPTHDDHEINDPNVVKVIRNLKGDAIYFSRSTIPHNRGNDKNTEYLKHIGIYAYRSDILGKITQLPASSLEIAESLEQLRWIENGYTIRVVKTEIDSFGIDTPEDLEKARNAYS